MIITKKTMYWNYVKKKKYVFCLILTELFLLKYIHKHMIGVPFYLVSFLFFSGYEFVCE